MPKISREQMDKDEVAILAELQKNSNESIDKIAKKNVVSQDKKYGELSNN
jgi:DNA-binding Lrp family transcriptional regulator